MTPDQAYRLHLTMKQICEAPAGRQPSAVMLQGIPLADLLEAEQLTAARQTRRGYRTASAVRLTDLEVAALYVWANVPARPEYLLTGSGRGLAVLPLQDHEA